MLSVNIPVIVASGISYTFTTPSIELQSEIQTNCGTLSFTNGLTSLIASDELIGGSSCNLTFANDTYHVKTTSPDYLWYPSIYLPEDIEHPYQTLELGQPISTIQLPQISTFVFDTTSIPNVIF